MVPLGSKEQWWEVFELAKFHALLWVSLDSKFRIFCNTFKLGWILVTSRGKGVFQCNIFPSDLL